MDEGSRVSTYLVKLGKDGQWQWTVSPPRQFVADYYNAFPPDSTPGFMVDLGTGYKALKTLKAEQPWPWKVVSVQDLIYDDLEGAETLLEEGWGAMSYQWGECRLFALLNIIVTDSRQSCPQHHTNVVQSTLIGKMLAYQHLTCPRMYPLLWLVPGIGAYQKCQR